jgi:hypothetical protein
MVSDQSQTKHLPFAQDHPEHPIRENKPPDRGIQDAKLNEKPGYSKHMQGKNLFSQQK